jgi:hypothetical protein
LPVCIAAADIEVALSTETVTQLAEELSLTTRKGADLDAIGAARLLQAPPGDRPIQFDRREGWAVLRALDNLFRAGRLNNELTRLRDSIADEIPFEPIAYDLFVIGFELEQMSVVSRAGRLEVGDRLLTKEGVWRVREVTQLTGGGQGLTCVSAYEPP